jgi:hypothetical protein
MISVFNTKDINDHSSIASVAIRITLSFVLNCRKKALRSCSISSSRRLVLLRLIHMALRSFPLRPNPCILFRRMADEKEKPIVS